MLCLQEEAREAVASPVEAIADSLDEEAAVDGEGGGKLASAIRGEFGEYDFDDAQLQVRFKVRVQRKYSHASGWSDDVMLHVWRTLACPFRPANLLGSRMMWMMCAYLHRL
jgi:hypothetical protein